MSCDEFSLCGSTTRCIPQTRAAITNERVRGRPPRRSSGPSPEAYLLAHRAGLLRRRTVPTAVEPRLHLRPFRKIEEKRAVECARDIEIAHREFRPGEPLRFGERRLQHVQ